eukprot:Gb_07370 [translate_table: standard]
MPCPNHRETGSPCLSSSIGISGRSHELFSSLLFHTLYTASEGLPFAFRSPNKGLMVFPSAKNFLAVNMPTQKHRYTPTKDVKSGPLLLGQSCTALAEATWRMWRSAGIFNSDAFFPSTSATPRRISGSWGDDGLEGWNRGSARDCEFAKRRGRGTEIFLKMWALVEPTREAHRQAGFHHFRISDAFRGRGQSIPLEAGSGDA